jgi:protein-S-isoprenylcysteine O-methyltransferase Ste14
MTRFLGLLYGVACYAFFLVTFCYAIGFIANAPGLKTIDGGPAGDYVTAMVVNLALLGLFAVQHTVMARQGFKRWWTRIVPKSVERSTFVLAATLVLALVLWQWRPMPGVVWSISHPLAQLALWAIFGLGWAILLLSTFLLNHFELFGLKQVYDNLRGRPSGAMSFKTPLLYKHVRHPLYLGFVLGFWATPVMSEGHLLFAVACTGYILIGIWFEERDLIAQFGDEYRRYRERVPMLIPFLGRKRESASVSHPAE